MVAFQRAPWKKWRRGESKCGEQNNPTKVVKPSHWLLHHCGRQRQRRFQPQHPLVFQSSCLRMNHLILGNQKQLILLAIPNQASKQLMHTGKGNAKIKSAEKTILLVFPPTLNRRHVATTGGGGEGSAILEIPKRAIGRSEHGRSSTMFVNTQTGC